MRKSNESLHLRHLEGIHFHNTPTCEVEGTDRISSTEHVLLLRVCYALDVQTNFVFTNTDTR